MTQLGNDLERDLREALRRKEPSAGFTARVLANLPEDRPSRWEVWLHQPALRWATAAVVVVAITTGGFAYREHERKVERGRLAKQQLMLALRITGAKLQLAQHRVQQIGAGRAAASQQQMERE
jgi:hypothetical protein